ncbi:MAG: hypothetical protein AAFV25_22835 [Bacteroidota bacterium]
MSATPSSLFWAWREASFVTVLLSNASVFPFIKSNHPPMKIRWCWRCRMDIPMLNKEEFQLCQSAIAGGKKLVETEMAKRGIRDCDWLGVLPAVQERFRYFIDMYRLVTGFAETNANAIWHHVIDEYGPDCPRCHKPLRTRQARYCAACGFGMQDLTSQDTKPLVERRPDLFGEA